MTSVRPTPSTHSHTVDAHSAHERNSCLSTTSSSPCRSGPSRSSTKAPIPFSDALQDIAGVDSLFLATPTWTRGTGGRQIPGHRLPDHGAQEYDHDWVGGNYATVRQEFYGNTVLGSVGRAPEHPDLDLFDDVIGAAKSRGMTSYAWIEESGYAQALRDYPNFPKVLEVDVWVEPSTPTLLQPSRLPELAPEHRRGLCEVLDLDGLAWCSERPGPLNLAIQRPVDASSLSCFCVHCRTLAKDQGIDARRAQEGMNRILEWNQRTAHRERRSRRRLHQLLADPVAVSRGSGVAEPLDHREPASDVPRHLRRGEGLQP